jgi:hypothetical protein
VTASSNGGSVITLSILSRSTVGEELAVSGDLAGFALRREVADSDRVGATALGRHELRHDFLVSAERLGRIPAAQIGARVSAVVSVVRAGAPDGGSPRCAITTSRVAPAALAERRLPSGAVVVVDVDLAMTKLALKAISLGDELVGRWPRTEVDDEQVAQSKTGAHRRRRYTEAAGSRRPASRLSNALRKAMQSRARSRDASASTWCLGSSALASPRETARQGVRCGQPRLHGRDVCEHRFERRDTRWVEGGAALLWRARAQRRATTPRYTRGETSAS